MPIEIPSQSDLLILAEDTDRHLENTCNLLDNSDKDDLLDYGIALSIIIIKLSAPKQKYINFIFPSITIRF